MKRRTAGAIALALLALSFSASPAQAHERRQVGPYTFAVGFLIEPAITGQANGVDLRVTETATNKPVEGLQDTLRVEVTAGGRSRAFKLRARFGQPGAYAADFVPTRASTYVFRFFGKIGDRSIDERFESGPNRFEEPEDINEVRFPPADAERELRDAADQARLLALAAIALAIVVPLGLRFWPKR